MMLFLIMLVAGVMSQYCYFWCCCCFSAAADSTAVPADLLLSYCCIATAFELQVIPPLLQAILLLLLLFRLLYALRLCYCESINILAPRWDDKPYCVPTPAYNDGPGRLTFLVASESSPKTPGTCLGRHLVHIAALRERKVSFPHKHGPLGSESHRRCHFYRYGALRVARMVKPITTCRDPWLREI